MYYFNLYYLTKTPSSSSRNSSRKNSSNDNIEKNGFNEVALPLSAANQVQTRPSPKSYGRKVKSLDMSHFHLYRTSSSSSDDSSKGKKLSKSNLTASFLKKLNKKYEPVYQLRKVNSESQTDHSMSRFHTS